MNAKREIFVTFKRGMFTFSFFLCYSNHTVVVQKTGQLVELGVNYSCCIRQKRYVYISGLRFRISPVRLLYLSFAKLALACSDTANNR